MASNKKDREKEQKKGTSKASGKGKGPAKAKKSKKASAPEGAAEEHDEVDEIYGGGDQQESDAEYKADHYYGMKVA